MCHQCMTHPSCSSDPWTVSLSLGELCKSKWMSLLKYDITHSGGDWRQTCLVAVTSGGLAPSKGWTLRTGLCRAGWRQGCVIRWLITFTSGLINLVPIHIQYMCVYVWYHNCSSFKYLLWRERRPNTEEAGSYIFNFVQSERITQVLLLCRTNMSYFILRCFMEM